MRSVLFCSALSNHACNFAAFPIVADSARNGHCIRRSKCSHICASGDAPIECTSSNTTYLICETNSCTFGLVDNMSASNDSGTVTKT
ncbi:unnamed protein product [Haemonchus placei]|uniref:Uncharacterized protein n=1 Tax=Haemonchus placei TaxID=6290 RepID=A0A3P7SZP6_HAEPC|nr:unnamed protein product [Haemonchus placei]